MDADADRDPCLALAVASLNEKLARGLERAGSVVLAGNAWDEEGDRLIADEFVHDPVPTVDDACGCAQKRVSSCPNSLGGSCSASPVDPRMSANIAEISTSAPPGCLCADLMHHVQSLRFSGDGLPPNTRMRRLPGLPNGA